eukprot:CCRYP_015614-RB/>CCRYP_015614-RB protein AED:0.38 eAED:0.38 QI:0/0/0/1/0/0/2/0/175
MRKQTGYQLFTKLEISMQYYSLKLNAESQDLCTIITPFGKYKYSRLPMGLKCSPAISQAAMKNILTGIEDADVYTDNVGAFSLTWEHHLDLLLTIYEDFVKMGSPLTHLSVNGRSKKSIGLVTGLNLENILADNISRLLCLPDFAQLVEAKKMVKPVLVSDKKDDEEDAYLMDHD